MDSSRNGVWPCQHLLFESRPQKEHFQGGLFKGRTHMSRSTKANTLFLTVVEIRYSLKHADRFDLWK